MSALETLRKETLNRHLTRLLTGLAKSAPNKELRIYAATLLSVDEGEAITETIDEATGEVVLRYSGRGSQHLIIGPVVEEPAWRDPEKSPTRPRIKTDEDLAAIEEAALKEQAARELMNQRRSSRDASTPFPSLVRPDGGFAP